MLTRRMHACPFSSISRLRPIVVDPLGDVVFVAFRLENGVLVRAWSGCFIGICDNFRSRIGLDGQHGLHGLERLATPCGLAAFARRSLAEFQQARSLSSIACPASRAHDRVAREVVEAHLACLAHALGAASGSDFG